MANLLSLPTELLIQILSDDSIASSDLWTCRQILCDGNPGNRSIFGGISNGLNSEALLPFVLLYTPNLQSLDMGDAKLDIMGPYVSVGESERIYQYCTVEGSQNWRSRVSGYSLDLWNPSIPEEVREDGCKNHYSFLYLHMRLDPGWLPGLSNITHLAHGCHRTGGYFDRWPASHLILMMLLPRLETAQFYGATILRLDGTDLQVHTNPLELDIDPKVMFQKSTIKHLELLNCRFRKQDYRSIAQITGSLQFFKCILEHEEVPWGDYAYESDVHDLFRLYNSNTLKNEFIQVSRATGEDKDPKDLEKKIDYGPDDDYFYDSDGGHFLPYVDDEDGWTSGSEEDHDSSNSLGPSHFGDGDASDVFKSDGSQQSP
ncbi:hypothetical protein TWF970_002845 [Orbilia oligospora]|uniref:Uncharacterized protein n=1 Tax=Orbilia oligospora TaxID=2813651 RepID=A0A7C8VFU5_ORBOL|nr:hypothetical protein TWF970_002845 [Orbilia oligospora]